MLSDWTPHETVADLRRVAEEVVALAVVGANETEPFVVPGDADARLARAALAAELAALALAAAAAGVAGAGAAGSSRRAARARARFLATRRATIGHLLCCAAGSRRCRADAVDAVDVSSELAHQGRGSPANIQLFVFAGKNSVL